MASSSASSSTLLSPSRPLKLSLLLYILSQQATSAFAYSWSFQSAPKQCSNFTINITGTDGRPPYRILVIPYGASPLANNVEARTILDVPFDGTSTSLTFKLKYPENSQFVAVVSDASGFGSGGTSVAAQVGSSDDNSCFDSTTSVQPQFFFSIEPANQIVQCTNTRLWWDPSVVQGTPNFLGVIPGGQSFAIPQSTLSNVPNQGTGFTWRANLRAGTTMILVGGDNRGNGTAGSSLNVVSAGISPDASCLDSSSPSSTPGSPAGGSYPTGSTTPGGSGSGGGSNVGAIVGGVVGGLVLLISLFLVLFFYRRRQRDRARRREKPMDLISADDDDEDEHGDGPGDRRSRNDLPQFYQPEPFTVPDPTIADTDSLDGRRPLSGGTSTSFYTRSGTPDGSVALGYGAGASTQGTTTRKGAPPRMMRPVNIIQHDDAGPSYGEPPKDEEETIELPPAYTALKTGPAPAPAPPAAAAAASPAS